MSEHRVRVTGLPKEFSGFFDPGTGKPILRENPVPSNPQVVQVADAVEKAPSKYLWWGGKPEPVRNILAATKHGGTCVVRRTDRHGRYVGPCGRGGRGGKRCIDGCARDWFIATGSRALAALRVGGEVQIDGVRFGREADPDAMLAALLEHRVTAPEIKPRDESHVDDSKLTPDERLALARSLGWMAGKAWSGNQPGYRRAQVKATPEQFAAYRAAVLELTAQPDFRTIDATKHEHRVRCIAEKWALLRSAAAA